MGYVWLFWSIVFVALQVGLLMFIYSGTRCKECKRWFVVYKTGARRTEQDGVWTEYLYEVQCRNCGTKFWWKAC